MTRDGSPTIVPTWFVLDGEPGVRTGEDSAKAGHFRRDPRAALVVDVAHRPRAAHGPPGTMAPMDLRQLEYFVAVARHRHFRLAAESLYVTQSAVSQQVRRLEAELGVQLLRRTNARPPVQVTAAGAELLTRAEAILADAAAARAAMDAHAGVVRGAVRVVSTPGDALRLAPALARFHAGHPAVRISLRQGTAAAAADAVRTGAADLAVVAPVMGTAAPEGLEAAPLRDEPLVLIVAPGDPLEDTGPVTLWDLRDRPFILGEPGTALREVVVEACSREGFGPVPLFEVGDPTAVRFLVHAGLGVSLVPASWMAQPGPEVAVLAPAGPAPGHALALLSRPGALTPLAGLLAAALRAELGD
ncbi:LysR substrate-binding domain-containing protein [Baekduia soli]|uniref:LysR substrate-binding domain-containing protein n=1 Tax=Baekduia soli TaxID=496014 RepID=UPI0016528566|nr:LysR substrate-binding domain-containing protein [Baekduia soli]